MNHASWVQLHPDVKAIIRNTRLRAGKAECNKLNAAQMAYGVTHVPDELWCHLPHEARSAITRHNNSLGPSFGAYMHNPPRKSPPARYMHQMNRLGNHVQNRQAPVLQNQYTHLRKSVRNPEHKSGTATGINNRARQSRCVTKARATSIAKPIWQQLSKEAQSIVNRGNTRKTFVQHQMMHAT